MRLSRILALAGNEAVRSDLPSNLTLGGAPPHTPARSLAGGPTPRAAPSQARRRRASTHVGLGPTPGSVACGGPYAPRRSLAGAPKARLNSRGARPHTPARSLAGGPTPRAAPSQARRRRASTH